jgi:hypothetical protein
VAVNDEPEYLRRLREYQRSRTARDAPAAPVSPQAGLTPPEQECIRWARQVARGAELRSIRSLAGARYAAVLRLQSASGVHFLSLEGLPDRAALIERVKPGATVGEDVLGAYEVRGGRPIVIETDDAGQVVLRIGAPRPGARPINPEKMLRQAAAQAAEREKLRPKGRGGGARGLRGPGGPGGPAGRPDRGRSPA